MIRRNPIAMMLFTAIAGVAGLFARGGDAPLTHHNPGKHSRNRNRRRRGPREGFAPRERERHLRVPPTGRLALIARLATGGRHPKSYPSKWDTPLGGAPGAKRRVREDRAASERAIRHAHSCCRRPRKHLQAPVAVYRLVRRYL